LQGTPGFLLRDNSAMARQGRPLTEATVGVAMGSGTDVARESADIVLLGNDLDRSADTVAIVRRTRHIRGSTRFLV
jgi:high-affinity K+ transport system ATPase subunit B